MKKAPTIRAITGSLAEHGIKVDVMIVIFLSLSDSIVLDAWIPGTPHPVATMAGINDFPESPNLLKSLSMIKATLAIYPISSRILNSANNTIICGKNPNTAPTPASAPSVTRPVRTGWIFAASIPACTQGIKLSSKKPFTASVPNVPGDFSNTAKKYTKNITRANIGRPQILLVTILSILSVVESFGLAFTKISDEISSSFSYLSLVIMLSASSSSCCSILSLILSISARSFDDIDKCFNVSSSFSKSLIA